jgi:hypothetical protein
LLNHHAPEGVGREVAATIAFAKEAFERELAWSSGSTWGKERRKAVRVWAIAIGRELAEKWDGALSLQQADGDGTRVDVTFRAARSSDDEGVGNEP